MTAPISVRPGDPRHGPAGRTPDRGPSAHAHADAHAAADASAHADADRPPGRGAHRSRTADLTGRVDALERALAVGADRLAPDLRQRVGDAAAAVRERLTLGVDHALVALVGGTGSGKSSLFNAVCGLPFSDVGVRRPTTSEVTACVWGGSGEPLLDWLGVARERRFERETALDGDAQADLRGLVLLDVPDHDSLEAAHREVVDRLLPMVDLLVWVVDPQKYADDALHTGYLRGLVGREAAMVVVLNQVDTVPVDVRERLAADVARLLAEDGLTGVPVLATSVVDGTGIGDLRATLARVVAGPSIAAVRAGAEVGGAARVLAAGVGPGEPLPEELPTESAVDSLGRAVGLPIIAGAVERAVRGGPRGVPGFGAVQRGAVEVAQQRWLADVGAGLPPAWRRSLGDRLPPAEDLRLAVDGALRAVPVVARRSVAGTVLRVVSVLAAVAAVLTGAVLVAGTRVRSGVVERALDLGVTPLLAAVLAGVAVVVGAAAAVVRRRAARRRGDAVRSAGRSALGSVVEERLVAPTEALLAEHREVRMLALTAGGVQPGGVQAGGVQAGGVQAGEVQRGGVPRGATPAQPIQPSPAGAHARSSTV